MMKSKSLTSSNKIEPKLCMVKDCQENAIGFSSGLGHTHMFLTKWQAQNNSDQLCLEHWNEYWHLALEND